MRHSVLVAGLAALVALTTAAPAHALMSSDIGAGGAIILTGNGADDIVSIKTQGASLVHDQGGTGGFATNSDWDTGVAGTQGVAASALINVNIATGDGNDFVAIGGSGGTGAALLPQDYYLDGGGGFDGLRIEDGSDTTTRSVLFNSNIGVGTVAFGAAGADGDFQHQEVEGVITSLGSGSETVGVIASSNEATLQIEGGPGADTFNVGSASGLSSIAGRVDIDGDSGAPDTVNLLDGGSGFGGTYLLTPASYGRSGAGYVSTDSTLERVNLTATPQADAIFKSGSQAVTINAGGGDDLISARDSIGDTANCGAGTDFVLSDALDTLTDCEASDRTLSAPPQTITLPGETTTVTIPAPPGDTTAPTAAISGVKSSIKRKTLLKGLKAKVLADERASYEVQLLGSTSSVRLSRTYNVTLAKQSLALDTGPRDITLKPGKRLVGKAKKFSVRVVVTPTDAAGNRGKPVVRTLKVKP
jgi:hypothetical protein